MAKQPNWDDRLGSYVLRMLFRRRGDEPWPAVRCQAVLDDRWQARLRLHKVNKEDRLEIMVGIYGWKRSQDNAERKAAVANAFRAGLKIAARDVGIRFPGLETR